MVCTESRRILVTLAYFTKPCKILPAYSEIKAPPVTLRQGEIFALVFPAFLIYLFIFAVRSLTLLIIFGGEHAAAVS